VTAAHRGDEAFRKGEAPKPPTSGGYSVADRRFVAFTQGRFIQFTSKPHVTECLEHIQGLAGNTRPAKGNRADVTEHRQQPLRTQNCSALVNAAHRRARDNIVVNRYKRQCGKSRQLTRHSRSPALTNFTNPAPIDSSCLSPRYHPYAALCSAASEAIVVNDGADDRFSISIRIQAYKIGIIFLT
jgi:hypothetical protein